MKATSPFVLIKTVKPKKRRLILLLFGAQKAGKTHFSVDNPGDTIYMPFEPGLEGVIEKFPKRNIYGPRDKDGKLADYVFAKPTPKKERDTEYLESVQLAATPVWNRFLNDWYEALRSDARNIVVDTAGAMYDLGRFAYLGTAGRVAAKEDKFGAKNGAVKSMLRGLVAESYQYDKNIIFLAREKQVWTDGEPVQEWKPEMWDGLSYEVQVVARISKKTVKNTVTKKLVTTRKVDIIDSRIDGDFANGLVFGDAKDAVGEANFVSLASTITSSDPSEWV